MGGGEGGGATGGSISLDCTHCVCMCVCVWLSWTLCWMLLFRKSSIRDETMSNRKTLEVQTQNREFLLEPGSAS